MDEPLSDCTADLMAWAHSPDRLQEAPLDALFAIVDKINELGMQIGMASLVIRTPHPQLDMLVLRWRPREVSEVPTRNTTSILGKRTTIRNTGVQDIFPLAHGHIDEGMWRESPFFQVLATQEVLRLRLSPRPEEIPFTIVGDLIERGMTDYAVFPVASPSGTAIALSLASRRPHGFTDAFFAGFLAALAPLSLSLSFKAERIQFGEVLAAYLGTGPAARVLAGQVRRGDLDSQEAAIGFADLRGFSRDSERLEPNEVLSRLGDFFELVFDSVAQHGGEVLKFLGDGVLFIFPNTSTATETCDQAASATEALSRAILQRNRTLAAPLHFGCALHYGSVLYGNIGAPARLDFTVIGEAVNRTARLESLCSTTGRPYLFSQRFAELTTASTEFVGEYDLKGFSARAKVFAPRRLPSSSAGRTRRRAKSRTE